jgi:hypothetical protein
MAAILPPSLSAAFSETMNTPNLTCVEPLDRFSH